MRRRTLGLLLIPLTLLFVLNVTAATSKEDVSYLWPEGKMPDLQEHQVKSETPRLESP